MEDTAKSLDVDKQKGVEIIKSAFDKLPENVRKFVTGLSFYQKSDGYYGLTQSLAGSTRLNTQYYNLQNFDQSLGTLYHEISHSIDGKTYTNNGPEYSLSRDEKVVPLLKAIAPNAPVFETWSNLFAKYVMTRVNQDVARSENENKAMKYFDDLLGEALFGSKAYNQEGMLSVQQDGVSVAIVNEGIQIKIDDGKKFRKGERLLLTVNMPQRNIDAIIPRGDIRIQGVTVGNVKLEYPNLGKTPREVALTAFYEKMRAKELNVWTKADLDEYFEIQKLSDNVWGYVVLSFDSEKINNLSNRTILLKSTELHKDQNVLENRMVYEKRLDVSDKGTNGTLINHKLIKEFANTHSDKWRLNLDDYMGMYDQLMPKTLDNEIIGTLNFNNETVKEFHLRPALWFDQIHDDATGKVRDRLVSIMNYDYDTARTDVNISKNSSFANYSELLRTNVLDVKIPSSMTVVSDGRKSEKERIFEPGDMKQEFFLNSDKSGLTVKPELIGTTQHFSMDKINDYTTVADVIWSDDHSWGSFKPSEVIKDITTHYEWDVIYEKDKITIVNTNEVHMPKYALMENLGPQLSIGKELMFDENVIFNDVDNWKYGGYYYTKGYATSAISGYHHTYYHDSLNNEKKEFTSKPEPYYLLLDLKSIEGSGNQLPHNVVVQYVDQTGKEIKLPKTIKENANYADSYKYEPETIEGYQFMGITEDSAPLKGLVGYTDKVIKVKYFDLSQPTTSEETQTKEITRTIQVTTPDGQTQEEIQKVTYRHNKVTNLITGEVTYTDWSSTHPQFDAYTVPVVSGYTATKPVVEVLQTNPDMENQVVDVTYTADKQENKVLLWDNTLNQSVGEVTIQGVTASSSSYDLTDVYDAIKEKYDVDSRLLTGSYTFKAEGNEPIKIPVAHKKQLTDESKDVHRVINLRKPDGTVEKKVQTVTYTRNKTTDLVTGDSTYTDWTSENPMYEEYIVPSLIGYKPSQDKVVSSESVGVDESVDVTYEPIEQNIHAKLVNERGDVLKDIVLTGKTNEDVAINWGELTDIRDKYVVGDLPSNWHVDVENNQDIIITVKDKLTEEPVTKDVTRTIHVTNPDGQTHDETQTVTFNGKKVTNEATGEVTYKDWTTDDDALDSYQVPSVPGYTATHTEIAEIQVTPDTSNQVVNVTYSANAQQNSIEFYDDDTKQVIFTKDITGKTGEKVSYDATSDFEAYQDKYETNDVLNGTWNVQPENNEVIRVHVTHKTKTETESKDVHRTINVHKPDGSVETITQTVTFTRTKTTDLVTNESTYTDWASEDLNYEEYNVPALTGYKPSQNKVESSKSTGTDEVIDVTYEPVEQNIHVKIVNERGETLKDFEVTGKTDENVKINYPDLSELTPKYDLGNLPETWTVQKENNQDIVITAKDKLIEEPVTKEIKRTINLHQPDGDKQEVQKVIYTGTKVTNEATGEVIYKDWSTDDDTFEEYQIPQVEGYSVAKDVIPSEKVDKDTVDEVIDIDYVANMQDITIEIVDENNKVLAMKEVHAKTGENVQYDMTKMFESFKDDYLAKDALSGTYQVQAKDNHVLIHASKRHHSDSETKAITRVIHVTNPDGTQKDVTQTATFTRSKTTDLNNNQVTYGEWKANKDQFDAYDVPKVNGYVSNIGTVEAMKVTPDTENTEVNVSYTENVTETTEEKDFVRYIIVQKPDGSKETITQKVHGTRTKTVHEASGDTSYSDWTLTQGSFDAYTPTSIEGYRVRTVESVDVDTPSEMPLVEYVVYQVETKDEGTQTETPSTSDSSTQTDNPDTSDGSTQTDGPNVSDGSTQTDEPDTSDGSTQTDTPDSKDDGTQTDNPDTSDTGTQTKAEIKVVYKNADGTVYKEFVVNADKGTILDASDLEMLPDDMNFDDDFMFYEVKGDGNDAIERIVKKHVSDEGTQTETPETNDQGSQTDNPDTSDGSMQTDEQDKSDGSTQTDTPDSKDNGTQTDNPDTSDGSTQTDEPDTSDGSTQTDTPDIKDDGTQTDNPDTSDTGTQTKAEIKVIYKNADGTVYKEFVVNADKGTILDASDLEMLPDDMDFDDDFMFYEVKGDGSDAIERIVKKLTSDQGSQTDNPDTSDGSTQTDEPDVSDGSTQTNEPVTSDGSTQTDTPDSKDNGTQTDNPDTSDGSTQTKAEIKVVYKNADGTVYKEFVVNADKGTILDASDLEMLPDVMDFDDDFMFYEVKGDGSDVIGRIVKKLTSDQGSQTDEPDKSDGSTQTDTPDIKDDRTQTNKLNVSGKGSQTDKPYIKDDATQTDRLKDEPIQSIPKQDGISKAKPLSNKVVNGYTGVQPIKSPSKVRLPKAGSVDNSELGLIGAAMSMLGSILGFVIYRKKH